MGQPRHLVAICVTTDVSPDLWAEFLENLRIELASSRAGELVESKTTNAREAIISLTHPDYGREIVDLSIARARLFPLSSVIPRRWERFACEDYFQSGFTTSGASDRTGFPFVWPRNVVYEDASLGLLTIGCPGCDGITWGYRERLPGLWAWYPIEEEFRCVAPTLSCLVDGWLSGSIAV